MLTSLYRPGTSRIHKMRPGPKLAALLVVGTLLFALPGLPLTIVAFFVSILLYPLAGLGIAASWRALKSVALVTGIVAAAQVWFSGPEAAILFAARLASLLLFSGLVTQTTRTSDMVDAFERMLGFLRLFGVDPARVGLAMALAIRFVPVLASIASDIREAQAARGRERSILAMGTPLILRTLRMADEVAEAIDARS